jgi:predicted ABC-class ATPase
MDATAELRSRLRRIDGRSYRAYQELRGEWELSGVWLFIDHVQGDPFAAPSRVRLRVEASAADWSPELLASRARRIGFEDYLARATRKAIAATVRGNRGSGKSGSVSIDAGRQAILERTAASADSEFVEVRLEVGLPASGRRVLGSEAESLLLDELPALADTALHANAASAAEALRFALTAENHLHLQSQLERRGLVAFIPDGALLPRRDGASQEKLTSGAVPFVTPQSLRVELELLNKVDRETRISGMGIRRGVTLIVGGGYHGKSTVLQALERAVHPHIPEDGRERVATLPSGVKIRAEEGRCIVGCDIHAFIDALPGGRSTVAFTSEDASGSTSQAASIIEALEAGAELLLLDEDTSATNFMVRDARMQALVARDDEPITPFLDRVRELYETLGISTILVVGGSGDYFDVADTVIEMRAYEARDVTNRAREIAAAHPTGRSAEAGRPLRGAAARIPIAGSLDPAKGRREVRIDVRGTDELQFGTETIDLRAVEPLIEPSQLRAIGFALAASRRFMRDGADVPQVLEALDAWLDDEGLEALDTRSNLARPRRFEISAALCRLRSLQVKKFAAK